MDDLGRLVVCAFLVSCAGDGLEERLELYRPRVAAATTDEKYPRGVEGLHAIARELVLAGDFELLEALERECEDPERRRAYWLTLARTKEVPGARPLLERWARREPGAIELAAYRPGGLEYLLARLEHPSEKPHTRAECVWALVRAGDPSVLPRLQALVDDPTPVSMRSLRAGSPLPTLGSIVSRGITELERQAGSGRGAPTGPNR